MKPLTMNYILGRDSEYNSTYIMAFLACLMIRHPRQVDRVHHRPPNPSNKYYNLSFIYRYPDIWIELRMTMLRVLSSI